MRGCDMSKIQQFYVGQRILITGGTGFLGKILIEKLIRSCPDIDTVYLLIREKEGKNVKERLDTLLLDSVFGFLRTEYPDFSKKIVAVTAATDEVGLGLSGSDYARLADEIMNRMYDRSQVALHTRMQSTYYMHNNYIQIRPSCKVQLYCLAASVRFKENIETAVAVNVNGVKHIIDFAKACKDLKAAVCVSTAYSNCVHKTIKEELYPPPLSYERVNQIVEDAKREKWPEDKMTSFTEGILGEWPNTYSFTKAIAEGVVAEFAKDLPFAVFRPSIVISSYREPVPGWHYGRMGFQGLILAGGLGILHVGLVDTNVRGDVVPVDYVCNALISCAWETASTVQRRHHEDVPVYNYVSGNKNPITWGKLLSTILMYIHIYPSNSSVYYPSLVLTKTMRQFNTLHFFLHYMPALIIEHVLKLFGKQVRLCKMVKKLKDTFGAVGYFNCRQWEFEDHRIQSLWSQIGPDDKLIFPFGIQNLDWEEEFMQLVRGLWKYAVKNSDTDENRAKWRLLFQYIVHVMIHLMVGISVLWFVYTLYCLRHSSTTPATVTHFG